MIVFSSFIFTWWANESLIIYFFVHTHTANIVKLVQIWAVQVNVRIEILICFIFNH